MAKSLNWSLTDELRRGWPLLRRDLEALRKAIGERTWRE
jgi:hypothetical protein